jgi:hypothetical protein
VAGAQSAIQPDGGEGWVAQVRRREGRQADQSIERQWTDGEELMGIFYRLARRWLGLTKIAIAIEKKVAKQASAYHLS